MSSYTKEEYGIKQTRTEEIKDKNNDLKTDYNQLQEVKNDNKQCNYESKSETKSNSKKNKRRAKALKAKITKIKSADFTERLNQSGKKKTDQACALDTSILRNQNKAIKSETESEEHDVRREKWDQHSAWDQIWLLDNDNHPGITELNKTLNILENKIAKDLKDENLDFSIQPTLDYQNAHFWPEHDEEFFYPAWKNKERKRFNKNVHIKCEIETKINNIGEFFGINDNKDLKSKLSTEEIIKFIDNGLNYLNGLLEKILRAYKSHWDRENDLNPGDVSSCHCELNHAKTTMRKLETEFVERVKMEFNKLIMYVKNSAERYFLKCVKLIEEIEYLLLSHKVRGKSILEDVEMFEIKCNEYYLEKFENVYVIDPEKFTSNYVDNILNKSKATREISKDTTDNNLNAENIDYFIQGHPDALYLQEVLALPPLPPPDLDKIMQGRAKTMENAYHLLPSILKILDDDSDNEPKVEENNKTKLKDTSSNYNYNAKNCQPLHDSLLVIPKVTDPNKLLKDVKQSQKRSVNPFENMPSRWCSIVRSLQVVNNYNTLLNGDVRISRKDKENLHIISTGGNFSPVVLGLDAKDRPLAVKLIRKDSSVSKKMKELLNPLLGLRNANLLHYFTCDYEENELVLATPLCEYNMSEYIMFMKQCANMYLKSIDVAKQFLSGLRFLHEQTKPIVHGNLKPSNIFIDLNGTVRIAEFGIHKALYNLIDAPNTSIIWFSHETYTSFKKNARLICTRASDIQVAGMLIHFILTSGKHPYGENMQDIIKNLEEALPQLHTHDVDLHDLMSWMLLYEPQERPIINQVLSHVFFWTLDKKWRFILTCAGINAYGTCLNIPVNELHSRIATAAEKENIKGSWINATKRKFPNYNYSKHYKDSITGLLKFIRNQIASNIGGDNELRNFILSSFSALPLSLHYILESSIWLNHHVLQPFTNVNSLFA